ncbi:hypothetical protein Tco_0906260 [Tanacetum coccineum]
MFLSHLKCHSPRHIASSIDHGIRRGLTGSIYDRSSLNWTCSIPPRTGLRKEESTREAIFAATVMQKSSDTKSKEENKVPPALAPAGTLEGKPVAANPLGDARRKVQEEIGNEFATMMASGTLCANEAAALATNKVMRKYVI